MSGVFSFYLFDYISIFNIDLVCFRSRKHFCTQTVGGEDARAAKA
jgi:hypothetical protein